MDNERTADVLQVALASYDRKELRVQKNYLEEQNPVLACTCFLNGHKLLQELQQGYRLPLMPRLPVFCLLSKKSIIISRVMFG